MTDKDSKITLTFSKVRGAVGYRIYDGGGRLVAEVHDDDQVRPDREPEGEMVE